MTINFKVPMVKIGINQPIKINIQTLKIKYKINSSNLFINIKIKVHKEIYQIKKIKDNNLMLQTNKDKI